MIRKICLVSIAAYVVVSGCGAQSSGPLGRITVKVVDAHGDAVPSAVVKFCPGPDTVTIGGFPECRTDASGTCSNKNLPLNTYFVRAMKPSDGYPDMTFQFYSHQSQSIQVVLTAEASDQKVLFKFGPKAASLKVNMLDDSTGSQVTDGTITLRGGLNSNEWIRVNRSADSTVLIPPYEDVEIEIDAPGYQTWKIKDHPEVAAAQKLRLGSGEKHEWTARLKHQ